MGTDRSARSFDRSEIEATSFSKSVIMTDMRNVEKGSVMFIGMLLGASFFGVMADIIGRKKTSVITVCIVIVGSFLSVIAPSLGWMILFRGIVGFGVGKNENQDLLVWIFTFRKLFPAGTNVAFSLLAEFLPSSSRSSILMFCETFWAIGTILESGIAYATLSQNKWRLFLFLSAAPSLILGIMFFFLPESPHFLSVKGETEKLMDCLRKIARINKKKFPQAEIVLSSETHKINEDEKLVLGEEVGLSNRAKCCKKFKEFKFFELFSTKRMVFVTVMCLLLWFISIFAYYGLHQKISVKYSIFDSKLDSCKELRF